MDGERCECLGGALAEADVAQFAGWRARDVEDVLECFGDVAHAQVVSE